MDIKQDESGKRGRFFIQDDDILLAEIEFSWTAPKEITIYHTQVDDSLEGKGVGKQLVEKVVALARENESKIVPLCSFAAALLKRSPAYKEVLV